MTSAQSDESLIAMCQQKASGRDIHDVNCLAGSLRTYNGAFIKDAADDRMATRLRGILEIYLNGRMTPKKAEQVYDERRKSQERTKP